MANTKKKDRGALCFSWVNPFKHGSIFGLRFVLKGAKSHRYSAF